MKIFKSSGKKKMTGYIWVQGSQEKKILKIYYRKWSTTPKTAERASKINLEVIIGFGNMNLTKPEPKECIMASKPRHLAELQRKVER